MKKNDGGTKMMKRIREQWARVKNELPIVLGNYAVNHFVKSFRDQGFTDESTTAWAKRKTHSALSSAYMSDSLDGGGGRKRSAKVYKKALKDSTRAILVKSGNLRRSIRVAYATWGKISVISDTDYSHIHNYGGIGKAWGKATFRMKQRRFIGFSHELNKKSLMEIRRRLGRVFR